MIPEVLKKPLVFGDLVQIKALNKLAEEEDFKDIPKCEQCDGTGEITTECDECCGEGKDVDAMAQHRKRYPL